MFLYAFLFVFGAFRSTQIIQFSYYYYFGPQSLTFKFYFNYQAKVCEFQPLKSYRLCIFRVFIKVIGFGFQMIIYLLQALSGCFIFEVTYFQQFLSMIQAQEFGVYMKGARDVRMLLTSFIRSDFVVPQANLKANNCIR